MRDRALFKTISTLALGLLLPSLLLAAGRDGRTFDPGTTMSVPAAGAPKELEAVIGLLGRWNVRLEHGSGETATSADCQAEVTLFNRGHGYMERMRCADWNGAGQPLATVAFVIYNPATELWARGEASSLTESITVSQGHLAGATMTLRNASRPGGGVQLLHSKLELTLGGDGYELTEAHSPDEGATWQRVMRRTYSRADEVSLLTRRDDYGVPAEGLPPEARQFDFLVGEWSSQHDMTFPNGQRAQWPAEATGVFALDGHGVVEFNWFDVDPSLPDAATTIVRVYNRAMRRWESLFVPNRGHSLLYFGGRWEDDRMVLHLFGADASAPTISRFIFHSIEPDRFGWFAEASTDRGATFNKTWLIDSVRKPPPAAD